MQKQLKIAMLDSANLTPFYNYSLSEALNKDQELVTIYSTQYLQDPTFRPPDNVKLVDFYFRLFRGAQAKKTQKIRQIIRGVSYPFDHIRLLKQFQKQKPDILHIQWSMLPVLDVMLVLRSQKMGIKVVHTVHDVTPLFNMGKHRRQEKLFQAVDVLIVHSEESLKAFRKRYSGVDPSKVHVIPHGPLQDEKSESYSKVKARQQLGIPEEAPVALFFGEIKHYKGLHQLVECFPEVAKNVEDAFLLIAGKPDSDESKPDTELLDRCGVSYKADLGFVPNNDVWKYYYAADVVVLPYNNISQSGVLFSAVANARPVITTRVGGLPEIVEAINAGWLVPEGGKEDLAAAISDALSNIAKTEELGLLARDKLNFLYGWDSIAQRTKEVYESLLK